MYMNFIDWMYKTSKRKKKQTYDMYWRRVCLYFSLFAEREMNNNVMKQMRRVWTVFLNISDLSLTNILVHQYSATGGRRCQCPAQTEAHHMCTRPRHPSQAALAVYGAHSSWPSAPVRGFRFARILFYRNSPPHSDPSELDNRAIRNGKTSRGDRG